MKKFVLFLAAVACSPSHVYAEYNANIRGVVTEVLTYTESNIILFRLNNQPASHPTCKPGYFSVDASVPSETRHQVLSRLLTAYATGKLVNIGYDKDGTCSGTWIRTHRVG
ncbi:hypothetical protein KDD30_05720 [Photobacterium sp. GJ3]|uniref:hypothetical protein n=1 Tax=Photobacterium sp. GJ3 TaxID=2829502 RepID=UPI001B8CAB79|nr:hypothetical protein [Photobacterium sp. GJ3]QUJ68610.1 hypothetical protein KDD30_05720 [Photobacterium sp. GJ3]